MEHLEKVVRTPSIDKLKDFNINILFKNRLNKRNICAEEVDYSLGRKQKMNLISRF
jgi:hypothetical protein